MGKLALVLFGILAGVLTALVSFEIFLRANDKYGIQSYKTKVSLGEDQAKYFVPSDDVFLGWEHNRKLSDVNSFGNYDKEYPLRKSRDTFRILVIGDSITENGRYVKRLEDLLALSGFDKKIEVWNCGVGCYGLKQYAAFIVNKAYKYDPDMLIIGFCMNDLEDASPVFLSEKNQLSAYCFPMFSKIQNIESISVNRFLLFNSYAYRFMIFKILGDDDVGNKWRADAGSLDLILKTTTKRNTPIMALLIPYLKSDYETKEQKDYGQIREILEDRGVNYLNLHGEFENIDDPSWRNRREDFIHPSEKGHYLIAEKLYKYLMDNLTYWYKG